MKDAHVEQALGIPQGSLSKTKAAQSPRVDRMVALADALGVQLGWLATGDGPKLRPGPEAWREAHAVTDKIASAPPKTRQALMSLVEDITSDETG